MTPPHPDSAAGTPQHHLRDQLGFKLSRAARLMQQRLERDLARYGLTRLTWCVLSSVGHEGITAPSGISDNIGITRPMLSRLLKSMLRDGLIGIAIDADDSRTRQVSLTALGQERMAACLPLVEANTRHFTAKFSPAEQQALHGFLDRLAVGEAPKLTNL